MPNDPTPKNSAADDKAYRNVVVPLLKLHCAKCHGPKKQEGSLNVQALTVASPEKTTANLQHWQAIRERLLLGEMPPDFEPRPDALTVHEAAAWIAARLREAGIDASNVDRRLLQPGSGNRVDHAALFGGKIFGPAASAARLWRMSPQSYLTYVPRISGIPNRKADYRAAAKGQRAPSRFAQPYASTSGDGFQDYADLFAVDEPTVVQLLRNARQIIEVQTTRPTHRGGRDRRVKEFLPLVNLEKPPTPLEIESAIGKQFQLALLREPTGEEIQRFARLAEDNTRDSGQVVGAKYMLATILMLPEAMYRIELGSEKVDEHGRRLLAPRELAYGIAFALTDDPPDAALLAAIEAGQLATREDVRRHVQRILSDEKIAKPRVLRFFEEYFDYPAVNDVFKDLPPDGRGTVLWRPWVLVSDTRLLIEYILKQDRDVLKELLTTNKSFVNYGGLDKKGNRVQAQRDLKGRFQRIDQYYGLPEEWEWTAEQPIELPADERAGILTQPSWLAAFATNDENHAIRRGKWVRERLLGGVIPDVPIEVDAQLPHAPEKTLRERMEVTKDQYCWRCHRKMNPLGLAFESYDFLGRYRTTEKVVDLVATQEQRASMAAKIRRTSKENTEAKIDELSNFFAYHELSVDSTGKITHSGDEKLNGRVAGTIELMRRLADSPHVRQVFVRHAFRYWMGRNETLTDAPTLLAADKAYVQSGGSMNALITSLLTSDSFLYRTETR